MTTTTADNLYVGGKFCPTTYTWGRISTDTTGTVAVGSGVTDSGVLFVATYAGTTTYTLPDPSATTVGAIWTFVQTADQDLVVTTATADNDAFVADGVATSDKVSIATSSHKIGGGIQVICISATQYLARAFGGATMTVEAAD